MQTAINISLSAGHFTRRTKQLKLVGMRSGEECQERLNEHLQAAQRVADAAQLAAWGKNASYGTASRCAHPLAVFTWTKAARCRPPYCLRFFSPSRSPDEPESTALILDGGSLRLALQHCRESLKEVAWCVWLRIATPRRLGVLGHTHALPFAVSSLCTAVLCCRLSPVQKAKVVRLVQEGIDGASFCAFALARHRRL